MDSDTSKSTESGAAAGRGGSETLAEADVVAVVLPGTAAAGVGAATGEDLLVADVAV